MSKEKCVNKKLHPYYKTGIYGWIGEEVDDNDYVICPICGEVLGMNYWDYSAEHNGDNKCPKCGQELDYSEVYDFEDTCYFDQLIEIKDEKIKDIESQLAEFNSKIIEEMELSKERRQIIEDLSVENNHLRHQLAEKNQAIEGLQEINKSLGQTCNNDAKEIERLNYVVDKHKEQAIEMATQLAEKDELLKQKIGDMKSTDFIKMCIKSGFMVEAKENDNQTAINELEKLLEKTQTLDVMVQSGHYINQKKVNVVFKDVIDQRISSLKGEK